MKLILAIVSNDDSASVSASLNNNSFQVTKLATTGGFPVFRLSHHKFLEAVC